MEWIRAKVFEVLSGRFSFTLVGTYFSVLKKIIILAGNIWMFVSVNSHLTFAELCQLGPLRYDGWSQYLYSKVFEPVESATSNYSMTSSSVNPRRLILLLFKLSCPNIRFCKGVNISSLQVERYFFLKPIWISSHQAVYWNTYRKIVETTLSVNSSSDISAIKKFVVTDNDKGWFDRWLEFVHVPYVSNKCFISILCSQSNGRNHTVHKMWRVFQ